jgi:hypothetical protein
MSSGTTAPTAEVDEKETPGLTAVALANWLFPLLREYAGKLSTLAERLFELGKGLSGRGRIDMRHVLMPEIGRAICMQEVLQRRVLVFTGQASALLDHATLEYETRIELALRWDETEESIRFSKLQVDELVAAVKAAGWLAELRKTIEKSGRYKSPV